MERQLAFITGATSGIGEALAYLLANKGFALILSGRDKDRLRSIQVSLQQQVPVDILAADLSESEGCRAVIQSLHDRTPNLVINNAGFGLYGDALTHSTEAQKKIVQVNSLAVLELTLEAARTLISKNKPGIILNVSSAAAFQSFPGMAVYAASKAFVNQFSEALDIEVQPYHVRVLTTCPGMVSTNFRERAGGKERSEQIGAMDAQYVAQKIWEQIQRRRPLEIINWKYRLLTYFSYLIPKRWKLERLKKRISKLFYPRTFIPINNK